MIEAMLQTLFVLSAIALFGLAGIAFGNFTVTESFNALLLSSAVIAFLLFAVTLRLLLEY